MRITSSKKKFIISSLVIISLIVILIPLITISVFAKNESNDIQVQFNTEMVDLNSGTDIADEPNEDIIGKQKALNAEALDNDIVILSDSIGVDQNILNIVHAINTAKPGGIVTVTGRKTNEIKDIRLNIPEGVTLLFSADTRGLSFKLSGNGNFEITNNGSVNVKNNNAIEVLNGSTVDVRVSGGNISVKGDRHTAIKINYGTAVITGGTITAKDDNQTICIKEDGFAAYLKGTCRGDVSVEKKGIIVEIDSLVPDPCGHGSTMGMTYKSGEAMTNVKWITTGSSPFISVKSDLFAIPWGDISSI